MNPAQSSVLTSALKDIAMLVAGIAVGHGYLHVQDQAPIADAVVTIAGLAISQVLTWYKTTQVTPQAMIDAVNSPYVPGRKVVSEGGVSPKVNTPLKEKAAPAPEADEK